MIDGQSVAEASESEQFTLADDSGLEHDAYNEIQVPETISSNYQNAWAIIYGTNECNGYKNAQYHYYGVQDAAGCGIVDLNGNDIAGGARWNDIGPEYANGMIAVREEDGGPWAFIDGEGNVVTEYIFDVALDNA